MPENETKADWLTEWRGKRCLGSDGVVGKRNRNEDRGGGGSGSEGGGGETDAGESRRAGAPPREAEGGSERRRERAGDVIVVNWRVGPAVLCELARSSLCAVCSLANEPGSARAAGTVNTGAAVAARAPLAKNECGRGGERKHGVARTCARESSIIDLAAGCETSTSRKIELPSLVMTMPPIGSRSILSIERGPSVVRMISETALPAAMLDICALRPVSRWTCGRRGGYAEGRRRARKPVSAATSTFATTAAVPGAAAQARPAQ